MANVESDFQPALARISGKGTSLSLALEVEAELVLCGLKMLTSIPELCKIELTQRLCL